MIEQLIQLTYLRVEKCHWIEEIIMESKNTQLENQALPKLESLEHIHLPQLTSIWAKDSLKWPFLQEVEISKCFLLKSLPFHMVNATKLRSIEGQQLKHYNGKMMSLNKDYNLFASSISSFDFISYAFYCKRIRIVDAADTK